MKNYAASLISYEQSCLLLCIYCPNKLIFSLGRVDFIVYTLSFHLSTTLLRILFSIDFLESNDGVDLNQILKPITTDQKTIFGQP